MIVHLYLESHWMETGYPPRGTLRRVEKRERHNNKYLTTIETHANVLFRLDVSGNMELFFGWTENGSLQTNKLRSIITKPNTMTTPPLHRTHFTDGDDVVYPCLSSSSDDHHLSHSCLGTGMRFRTQKQVMSLSCVFGSLGVLDCFLIPVGVLVGVGPQQP